MQGLKLIRTSPNEHRARHFGSRALNFILRFRRCQRKYVWLYQFAYPLLQATEIRNKALRLIKTMRWSCGHVEHHEENNHRERHEPSHRNLLKKPFKTHCKSDFNTFPVYPLRYFRIHSDDVTGYVSTRGIFMSFKSESIIISQPSKVYRRKNSLTILTISSIP